MTTIPKKKASGKDVITVAEAEVGVLLSDLGQALSAPSPFVVGGLLVPPPVVAALPPSSSSSSSSSAVNPARNFTDALRMDEMNVLKRKLEQLEDQARTAFAASAAAVVPSPSLATPNAEILGYFKSMEAIRMKEAVDASVAHAITRKEDLKSYEALSKKLSKKDDKAKHNLKQTTILLGTAEALKALSEG